MAKNSSRVAVVVANWNGEAFLADCLESLQKQTLKAHIIVVDNGSADGSVHLVGQKFPDVELIVLPKNRGFTGGVNAGIERALAAGYDFVALFNNDAVADKGWLAHLFAAMDQPKAGITTCKLVSYDRKHFDSTGECYSIWGLPFARGRDEPTSAAYDDKQTIFAATGGASLYRAEMLRQIGLFDNDFFAYYEDVDLSFRAQLRGWKVYFAPHAIARHHRGATSQRIKGFTTYQTLKNLPLVLWKNLPARYLWVVLPRFTVAYWLFLASAVARGQGGAAAKGMIRACLLTPKKLVERISVQGARRVSPAYIWQHMTHDLPPGATKLRKLFGRPNQKRTKGPA